MYKPVKTDIYLIMGIINVLGTFILYGTHKFKSWKLFSIIYYLIVFFLISLSYTIIT